MGGGGCCGGGSHSENSGKEGGCGSSGSCGSEELKPFEASDEQPVFLTPKAVAAVKHAIAEEGEANDALRISVVGGGCSGYQYNLDFDKEGRMGDIELSFDGLVVYVDPVSAGYLRGTVVDYVSGLQGTGFKFNNPNAKRSCGCGHSFS